MKFPDTVAKSVTDIIMLKTVLITLLRDIFTLLQMTGNATSPNKKKENVGLICAAPGGRLVRLW
jgi:hypothetical protein